MPGASAPCIEITKPGAMPGFVFLDPEGRELE